MIWSFANLVLVGIGDPSGEESASGVSFSRLLHMDALEDDSGEWHRCGGAYISLGRRCGVAVLLLDT